MSDRQSDHEGRTQFVMSRKMTNVLLVRLTCFGLKNSRFCLSVAPALVIGDGWWWWTVSESIEIWKLHLEALDLPEKRILNVISNKFRSGSQSLYGPIAVFQSPHILDLMWLHNSTKHRIWSDTFAAVNKCRVVTVQTSLWSRLKAAVSSMRACSRLFYIDGFVFNSCPHLHPSPGFSLVSSWIRSALGNFCGFEKKRCRYNETPSEIGNPTCSIHFTKERKTDPLLIVCLKCQCKAYTPHPHPKKKQNKKNVKVSL